MGLIETLQNQTRDLVGEDEDVSYISEDLIAELLAGENVEPEGGGDEGIAYGWGLVRVSAIRVYFRQIRDLNPSSRACLNSWSYRDWGGWNRGPYTCSHNGARIYQWFRLAEGTAESES